MSHLIKHLSVQTCPGAGVATCSLGGCLVVQLACCCPVTRAAVALDFSCALLLGNCWQSTTTSIPDDALPGGPTSLTTRRGSSN